VLLEGYLNYFYAIISAIASHKIDVCRRGENITTVFFRIRGGGEPIHTVPVTFNFNGLRLRERCLKHVLVFLDTPAVGR